MANSATLSSSKGSPQITITIGFAQAGAYRFSLWDADSQNGKIVFKGKKGSASFTLDGSVSSLNQRFLTWDVLIGAPATGAQQYSVKVNIKQQGQDVTGSPIIDQGNFTDSQFVHNWVRFTVV